METPALNEAQGKLDALRKELKDVFSEAGPERDMAKVKSLSGDSQDKVEWIRKKHNEIEDQAKKVRDIRDVADIAESNQKEFLEGGGGDTGPMGKSMSLGEAFVKSGAYKRKGDVSTSNISLKDIFSITDPPGTTYQWTQAGWPPESTRSGKIALDPQRPAPHVTDFIPTSTINQHAYKYMEETVFDNTSAETVEGGEYQEVALALQERTRPVEKITAWIPVTDEQLEDVDAVQQYLNQRMTLMLQQRIDRQVLLGDGNAPNLLGTTNVGGIRTQALGSDPLTDATYKLFTDIRENGFAEPSAVFLKPSNWQQVVLQKTADGQYIWGHPSSNGPNTLWGVPVTPTLVAPADKLITGDYQTHASIFTKSGIDFQTTNAHSDFFVKGKQAVRADVRLTMVHFRPEAFGTVTGL